MHMRLIDLNEKNCEWECKHLAFQRIVFGNERNRQSIFKSVKRVVIRKPCGGERLLGVPTVLDRVIQQAIAQVLQPLFDSSFSDSSFGYRPKCSQVQAILHVQQFVKDKRRTAIDVDLSKFFDRINHDRLMTVIGRKVHDRQLMCLIGKYLRAGVCDNG